MSDIQQILCVLQTEESQILLTGVSVPQVMQLSKLIFAGPVPCSVTIYRCISTQRVTANQKEANAAAPKLE